MTETVQPTSGTPGGWIYATFERPQEWDWFRKGLRGKFLTGFIIIYFLYHCVYTAGWLTTERLFITFDQFTLASICLTLVITFYLMPAKRGTVKTGLPWYDILFIAISIAGCVYLMLHLRVMFQRLPIDNVAVIIGTIFIITTLEGLRRCMGLMIAGMIAFFFLYAMFSNYFPGILWSTGFSYKRMIAVNYVYDGGMFGTIARLFAKLMVLYMIFATTIQVSGAGRALMKFALGIFGAMKGGPAKVAVVASGLFGAIAPAGPANVFVTGSITIPMMKRSGQTAEYAASVEAAASILGGLTPPIMGAIAFIVAEWLEMPYYMVMLAAIIPSILFFVCLYFQVDFQARRKGSALAVIPKEQLPSPWEAIKEGWYYVIPIALFVYLISVLKYSPQTGVLYAWVLLVLLGQIRKEDRLTPRRLLIAGELALKMIVMLGPVMLAIGIVLASLTITGVPLRFTATLTELCGGSMLLLLIMVAIASFIMGMGMPALAIYFILAALCAPALVQSGVLPIAAHLFIIYTMYAHYFTPPVMSGVIFTSTLAGSNIWGTAWSTIRLAAALFIVPFVFIYNPSLALQGGYSVGEILLPLVPSLVGIYCLSGGIQGWFAREANWPQRALLLIAGIMLIVTFTHFIFGIAGLCLLLVVLVWQGFTPMWLARKLRYAFRREVE